VFYFPQLIDAFPHPLLIAYLDGRIVYANPAWERYTGYRLIDIQGKNLRSILQQLGISSVLSKKILASIESGKAYSTNKITLLTKKQEKYNVHTLFFPIKKAGRPYYLVQTYYDISSIIKLQKKLQEKERLFQEMVDNSHGFAIYVMNKKGKIISWNKGAESVYGYSKKDVIGSDCYKFYPKEEQEKKRPQSLLQQAIEEGKAEYEGWHVKKDGSFIWVHGTITAVKNKQGRIVRFVKITHDITQRRKMEIAVQENERRMQEMLQNISLISLIIDMYGNVTYANPYYYSLTGFTEEEIVGKSYSQLVPQRQKLFELSAKKISFSTEGAILTKFGQERLIHWTNVVFHDSGGKPVGILCMGEDITDKKLIDEQKDAFFSLASHELKTPITTIKLLIQSALKRAPKLKLSLKELDLVDKEINRLTELIDEMLDIARINIGRFYLHLEKVDLNQLINETIAKVQFLAGKRKILFRGEKELFALADSRRIEQVVTNLLTNAIKYSNDKTSITIEAYNRKKDILMSVTDEGRGIPRNELTRIFERFYQVAPSKDNRNGFGLGLYICREIIRKHKGKIWATSEVGKGTTFYFTLPLFKES
jgi:PAS domain S-box-containing protein